MPNDFEIEISIRFGENRLPPVTITINREQVEAIAAAIAEAAAGSVGLMDILKKRR